MEDYMIVLIIVCVIVIIVLIYMFLSHNSITTFNQFPNGSFLIVPFETPYFCLSSSNTNATFVPCDPNDIFQQFIYSSSYTIQNSEGNCLGYNDNKIITASPCTSTVNSYFVYNSNDPVIQNTSSTDPSTLYMNINSTKTGLFMSNTSLSNHFLAIPPESYGPSRGRFIKVSVPSITCLNIQDNGIIVQSNPWDRTNAAKNAVFTQSSVDLCTGSPWMQLDFGIEIPITQITILGYNPRRMYIAAGGTGILRTLIGAVVTIGDYNNITVYTSDPIQENAAYTVFTPPYTKGIPTINAAVPLSCQMSKDLYLQMYPSVRTDAWTHYTTQGKALKYNWYGPNCP